MAPSRFGVAARACDPLRHFTLRHFTSRHFTSRHFTSLGRSQGMALTLTSSTGSTDGMTH
jgi:hypothetical protein